MKINKEKINEGLGKLTNKAGNLAINMTDKTKGVISKSKDTVTSKLDVTGDGKVTIEDIIVLSLRTPGVSINRNEFLSKEFMKKYPAETIEQAISSTPAKAGISVEEVDSIAEEVIKFERNCVASISFALGTPGGAAMAATIPADIIQYYGYMLRAAQKIMYLYGFPEIDTKAKGEKFDSETLNILILCLGVMYGVEGANKAIKTLANSIAERVEKQLLKAPLTKGKIYPIIKKICKWWFDHNLTKDAFAGFFRKIIPIVGGVVGGGITFFSFGRCCKRLQASLQDTILSNPNYKECKDENTIIDTEYPDKA